MRQRTPNFTVTDLVIAEIKFPVRFLVKDSPIMLIVGDGLVEGY